MVFRRVGDGDKSSLSHLDQDPKSRDGKLLCSGFDLATLIQRDSLTFFPSHRNFKVEPGGESRYSVT